MRTLIINSMFASGIYRRCADKLGKRSGIDLTMLTVKKWKMNGRPMPFDDLQIGSPYRTVLGKTLWTGYENRGFYASGIVDAFRLSKPEILFLMEEPFSLFAAEVLAVQKVLVPHIPIVFFTWNNLSLEQYDYRPSYFYRNVARLTLRNMHYGLTANLAGINVLRDFGFEKPLRVAGYGVDTAIYSEPRKQRAEEIRARLQVGINDKIVGYVGRLIEMKGVDLLIDAFAQLSKTDASLKLLLLGSGEAQEYLLTKARTLGISSFVRHIPSVPHKDVPDYMHALDILVLPSRRRNMWAEQFGRVIVEAMAAQKIVIGSSSGAIPEVIGDGGLVFRENEAKDLQAKLEIALNLSERERHELLTRAAARVRYFSWSRFASDAHDALRFSHNSYGIHK